MNDPLEDFIRHHRAELDIDEPSNDIWKHIESKIPSEKRRRLWSSLSVAASVLVLVVAAYFMGMQNSENEINRKLFASEMAFKEFQEASDFYTTSINHKLSQVKEMGVEEDVLNDMKQLDEVYNELKEEMLTTEYGDKEYLINLMINNYKTKIDILERIINKNKNNESKITDGETISI